MKKHFEQFIAVFIIILIVISGYSINKYSNKIRSKGIYTCCKIIGFKGFKNGNGLIFDIYYKNDTLKAIGMYNGDILKKHAMKDNYFAIRFVPNDPELNRVLLRYELNESIARQIDSGVSTLGQILILPGVKIHEEIVNFDDGL